MRRTALFVLLFLVAVMVGTAGPAVAKSGSSAVVSASDVGADFNNDGFADLAAAAPEEAVGAAFAAGAVSVLYGAGSGLSASGGQLFTQTARASLAPPRHSTLRWR